MIEFSEILQQWYAEHGRTDLPWRHTTDPYKIWISEIILQQTRVAQGYAYYERFIHRFPDVFALARASEDEVLKLWQGLGYYSRARNLHAAARSVAALGAFPTDYAGVRALQGIGDYTAAAVCSFAYRQPYAVVDGNVYRVLARIFGITTPIDTTRGKKEFAALAAELLDPRRPHIHNSAIMDFGALQCTPKSPQCLACPFSARCLALQQHQVDLLPFKSKKTAVTQRYLVYLYIEDATHILLHRRDKGDIWQGLYEPYLVEYASEPAGTDVLHHLSSLGITSASLHPAARHLRHQLTHRTLWIDCYRITLTALPAISGYMAVSKQELDQYPTPKPVTELFATLKETRVERGESREERG